MARGNQRDKAREKNLKAQAGVVSATCEEPPVVDNKRPALLPSLSLCLLGQSQVKDMGPRPRQTF